MKNRLVMAATLLALVAWVAPAARAGLVDNPSNIPANTEIKGKLQDASSLYRFTAGQGWAPIDTQLTLPQPGDEGRAVAELTDFRENLPFGEAFWSESGSSYELTALEYDFVIGSGTVYVYDPIAMAYVPGPAGAGGIVPQGGEVLDLYFIAGARHGGRIDLYLDGSKDYDVSAGPAAWVEGTAPVADSYATASDGTLWLTGTYMPLFSDLNGNDVRDPGEPDLAWFDLNANGVRDAGEPAAVFANSGWKLGGAGSGFAWINVTGGSYANMVVPDFFGAGGYDVKFESQNSNAGTVGVGPPGGPYWEIASEDPIVFMTAPEPSSMVLLGSALIGLMAYRKRKRA